MELKNRLIPVAGAFALGFLAMPAQAAPLGGAAGNLVGVSGETAGVEQVHRRYRYYRHYRPYHYYQPYHYYRPYRYHRPGIHLHFGL